MSQGGQSTKKQLFLNEWVVAIFYGNEWHEVDPGSYVPQLDLNVGPMAHYVDPYANEGVFIRSTLVQGYKVKRRDQPIEVIQGEVLQLHGER